MTEEMGGLQGNRLLDAEFVNSVERLNIAPGPKAAPAERRRSLPRVAAAALVERLERRKGTAECLFDDDQLRLPESVLTQLFRELFEEKEPQALHLLIDSSQSMLYDGSPEHAASSLTKFDFARKIAAAAGYVGLTRGNIVHVAGFAQYRGGRAPVLQGHEDTGSLLRYLQRLRAGGNTNFAPNLRSRTMRAAAPGVCLVISDFYDASWRNGLRALISSRLNVVLMHVLTPNELAPDLLAELRLVDAVTGATREFAPDSGLRACHRSAVEGFCRRLELQAAANGMSYLRVITDTPVESLMLKSLRSTGALHG